MNLVNKISYHIIELIDKHIHKKSNCSIKSNISKTKIHSRYWGSQGQLYRSILKF